MRATLLILVTTVTAGFALPRANAEPEEPKGSPATNTVHVDGARGPTTYLVQVDGVTVAILPANPKRTITVCCSGDATYNENKGAMAFTTTINKNTGAITYTNDVKLVASVPGQAAITITGDRLTLQPQK